LLFAEFESLSKDCWYRELVWALTPIAEATINKEPWLLHWHCPLWVTHYSECPETVPKADYCSEASIGSALQF
jgi:hypothetical protein